MNNDGEPNLNNSKAENENEARLAARCREYGLVHAFEPPANHTAGFAQACLNLEYVCFVCEVKLKNCPQMQSGHLCQSVSFQEVTCFLWLRCVFG